MEFSNAWPIEIRSPHAFLKWLISIVPNQSVWTLDGIDVDLNSESKPLIMAEIDEWNLDRDFIHQSIRCGEVVYFVAHDKLEDAWLSTRITADQLRPLITGGIASVGNGIEFEIASEERWQQLTTVFAALVEAQRTNSFPDIGDWSSLVGSEARAMFFWNVDDCGLDISGLAGRHSSESRSVDVLGTMIDQFKNGDCVILGWRKLEETRARVEYEPNGAGFGCLQVLVEAFGHRIDPVAPECVLLPSDENGRKE